MRTRVTMLNTMVSSDFEQALDQFQAWGLTVVDLKNGIYGEAVERLTPAQAVAAAHAMQLRGLQAYCLSTELFHDDLEKGEEHFRQHHLARVDQAIEVARHLKPSIIRLLSARVASGGDSLNRSARIADNEPWLLSLYQEAIDRIADAGFMVTIENEAHRNIWTNPQEIIDFFYRLNRPGRVHFTYDVQNLWQMGTFPTIEVYRQLRPLIGFLHLKGGKQGELGNALKWRSTLEEADWPVEVIVRAAIVDQCSPVICLNPSHGQSQEGQNTSDIVEKDLQYVNKLIASVEGESV
jgi:sugar phosphate isomerase/epimerase